MKITLKTLSLTNFKGIRSLNIDFGQVTNIYGTNATGKTTLMDAFLWLFFGKDSTDRKDFEIKTLDDYNVPYHKLDHEVSALILVDGDEINIRRSFKENWVKKRGEQESVFSGHTTSYFWNDIPLKLEQYQDKISGIMDESLFKLITNTNYFSSLNWNKRRDVLLEIAGDIDNNEIITQITNSQNEGSVALLAAAFNKKKSIDEFKKEIYAKKKKIKDELLLSPARINEANRSLPDEQDYAAIEALINEAQTDLDTTDSLLMNKSKVEKQHQEEITAKIREVGLLRNKMKDIEFNEQNSVKDKKQVRENNILEKKRELRTKQDDLRRSRIDYESEAKRKVGLDEVLKLQNGNLENTNKEELVFDDNQFCCPACHREFETVDIESKREELRENFNASKSKRLTELNQNIAKTKQDIDSATTKLGNMIASGKAMVAEIELMQKDIEELEIENIRLVKDENNEMNIAISSNSEIKELKEKISLLEEEINTPAKSDDKSHLLTRKRELTTVIEGHKKTISTKDQREKILLRIKDLEEQEQNMTQELADLEGTEFCIDQFVKTKMDTLESRINGRFSIVRFKMFEEQINGGQTEACTTLINGVPYADANTASKVAAGLDIVNVLSEHYGIDAPVWVDNRESVIHLPETNCQLINLVVSEKDKKLRVVTDAEMALA